MACGLLVVACMRDLVPQPGIETRPPALGAWGLTHELPGKSVKKIFVVVEVQLIYNVVSIFARSQFPNQGLNPGLVSESPES